MRVRNGGVSTMSLMLLAGCGVSSGPVGFAVRDSGGIAVLEHDRLPDRTAFQVGDPTYMVGRGGPDEYHFVRMISGTILTDGSAAVGDLGTGEVVVVDAAGRVASVLGGKGEGPGEIGALMSLRRLSNDTIMVEDDGNARMMLFHKERFVRSYRLQEALEAVSTVGIGIVDRQAIVTQRSYEPYFEDPWLKAPIVRVPLESERWDTIGFYDYVRRIEPGQVPNPFRPQGFAAVGLDGIFTARGDRPEVREMDVQTGRLRRIIRWPESPSSLTDSIWDEYNEWARSRSPRLSGAQGPREAERRLAAAAEPIPIIGNLTVDEVGRIWVAEFAADFRHPRRYRVFARDGAWLGWVVMPSKIQVLHISSDNILGVHRDELDVEAIGMWPIR